jgi:hypothetical protein
MIVKQNPIFTLKIIGNKKRRAGKTETMRIDKLT